MKVSLDAAGIPGVSRFLGAFCRVPALFLLFGSPTALAGEWTIEPRLEIGETYTDNVDLDPKGQEDWDLVTEVNPGLSVSGEGGRLTLDFDYRLQNLIYLRDSDRNDINHQLSGDATAELIKDRFFVDTRATVSQRNLLNTGRVARDNISGGDDRTDVVTYEVSPYWRHRFAGYADAELRYTQSGVAVSSGEISDSEPREIDLTVTSGPRTPLLTWSVNYHDRDEKRDGGDDFEERELEGQAAFRLTREFSLTAQAGRTESDFTTNRDIEDGSYWSLGGRWRPSRFFAVGAGAGNNDKFFDLELDPSIRTSLRVAYRDREVGSNPGGTWEGDLEFRNRRVRLRGSYFEETTTTQQLLLEQEVFPRLDPFGDPILDPTGDPILDALDIPTLSDEVFVRERFELFGSIRIGKKSDVDLRVFNERRRFEFQDDETVTGWEVTRTWDWRRNTTFSGSVELTHTEFGDASTEDEADDGRFTTDVRHTFGPSLDGTLRYEFRKRDSSGSDSDFEENRVEAHLRISF